MKRKLTENQAREIHALCGEHKLSDTEIGAIYGTSGTNVSYIRRCQTWKHLGLTPIIKGTRRRYNKPETTRERILAATTLDLVSGCWEWNRGRGRSGYGGITINRKSCAAHRISYETFIGPIPSGMHVCHKCDNKGCCNPDHLFLGTHQDNINDRVSKGRTPQGANHYLAIIDDDIARGVFEMSKEGCSYKEIMSVFNVTRNIICSIRKGFSWNRVTGLPKAYLKSFDC